MRISIVAVGRLRKGPELALVTDYVQRFERIGRSNGLGPVRIVEVDDRKGKGRLSEAALLTSAAPQGACVAALDERGRQIASPDFARLLQSRADDGTPEMAFLIGGADGLSDPLRARADLLLSFGQMVWPHMLARVMLCEQLYRAASILAGSPYHRA